MTPYWRSARGSTCTWYCLTSPPIEMTSATPGTVRRLYLTIQSWSVRSSMWSRVPVLSRTTYW